MSGLLKATLMVLGASCVLLLAGAFPVLGAPAVFRGGVMILLGIVAALLALWGGWRLSAGKHAQFLFGLVSLYFTTAGLVVAWMYGCMAVEHALLGGAMWFGALAMACTMVVGLLFASIFGFFLLKLMKPRLWLAGVHWCCTFIVLGAMVDFCAETRAYIYTTADNGEIKGDVIDSVVTPSGEKLPLGFTLQVTDFSVLHYEAHQTEPARHHLMILGDGAKYQAFIYEREKWVPVPEGYMTRVGDELKLPGRSFKVADVKQYPGLQYLCLLASTPAPYATVNHSSVVKEYSAACTVNTDHRGRPETRKETLKVNYPIFCKDWRIYLLDYKYDALSNRMLLMLEARRAPGRWFALTGMVGLIICTACWCWWKREKHTPETDGKETAAV